MKLQKANSGNPKKRKSSVFFSDKKSRKSSEMKSSDMETQLRGIIQTMTKENLSLQEKIIELVKENNLIKTELES